MNALVARLAAMIVLLATLGLASSQSAAPIQPTMEQLQQIRALLSTYENVDAALAEGFERFGDCMTGPQGAQGIHFTNGARIDDTTLDAMQPDVLMYEPRADGTLRLIGAEYLIFQQAWHDAGNAPSPALLGREFSLNTTLLDEPFYALHVWAWQHNPLGLFANWNPLATCEHGAAAGVSAALHAAVAPEHVHRISSGIEPSSVLR